MKGGGTLVEWLFFVVGEVWGLLHHRRVIGYERCYVGILMKPTYQEIFSSFSSAVGTVY